MAHINLRLRLDLSSQKIDFEAAARQETFILSEQLLLAQNARDSQLVATSSWAERPCLDSFGQEQLLELL